MFKLRKKFSKAKQECRAYDSMRHYNHNLRDYIFYKSMNFRSSYLEEIEAAFKKQRAKWASEEDSSCIQFGSAIITVQYTHVQLWKKLHVND